MAFDQSKLGQLAAELMDNLEGHYGEDAEIGDVTLIVEITSEEHGSQIAMTHSNPRAHVNLGLVEAASHILRGQIG
jgi:hypothetical protein